MGMLWDLMQESAIAANRQKAATIEGRVEKLERELAETRQLLSEVAMKIKTKPREDVIRGSIG